MTISCGNGKGNVTPQNVIISPKCNINTKCTMQYELLHTKAKCNNIDAKSIQ